ncbi:MAG TPA: alpha/beta hydrolase-fold protein [Blastocatellia bacterium]|nr:alpha/beta hydrolase-fold protein [Blastocatellia bacterium]
MQPSRNLGLGKPAGSVMAAALTVIALHVAAFGHTPAVSPATRSNAGSAPASRALVQFHLAFSAKAGNSPADGRMFLFIAKTSTPEPRLQTTDYRGCTPFFGVNVDGLNPGQWVTIDDGVIGYPLEHLHDLPEGDYYVQGMLNIYTTFNRSDGHVVKMHMDHWEGQQFQVSPGNIYCDPVRVHITPDADQTVSLLLDRVIPPILTPPDTDYVKRIKFQSPILSRFWGQPIYIGATILLPRGYDTDQKMFYPVNYEQGHFSTAAPGHFASATTTPPGTPGQGKDGANQPVSFSEAWQSDHYPRMLYVTFQHPTPYYDDSYAVDSPNVGPYGTAITQELIPYIESHFRAIPKPWARILSGGSTGGWESLALQIFYPDYFGGTFSACPDPVDFHFFQLVDIYNWPNAWYRRDGWVEIPIPGDCDVNGVPLSTMKQQLDYEVALGDHGRSGQQWAIWEAVYGPLGDDGYYRPLIDPGTGSIDKLVAEYWQDHMDLTYYLRTHWAGIGTKLDGKIHIWVGDMDTYYLNDAVHLMDTFLRGTTNPAYGGSIVYGPRMPHCWSGPDPLAERLRRMAEYIHSRQPAGSDSSWWSS